MTPTNRSFRYGNPDAGNPRAWFSIFLCGCALASAWGGTRPIAQWSFEDAANLGKDSIGGHDLTACIATSDGTPNSVSDGHLDKAAGLKRTSSTVGNAFRSAQGVLPTGSDPFTISAWVRPDSASASTAYLVLHTQVSGGKPNSWTGNSWAGWHIRFAKDGALAAIFSTSGWIDPASGDAGILTLTVPAGCYKDGKWHHVALTRDAANAVRLFWDGRSISKTIDRTVTTSAAIRLGSYSTANGFSGDYDEVKAWDVSLSDEEILREYNARVTELAVTEAAVQETSERVYAPVTGNGTLTLGGASYQEYLASLGFGGVYRLYSANVDFGYADDPRTPSASAMFDIAGGGSLNLFGDATVAGLSGTGLMGGVNVAAGKTLTVAAATDGALSGALTGAGTVAKDGSGTLTLKGATTISNVTVNAGTLAVNAELPFYRKDLVAYWRFDENATPLRDLCGGEDLQFLQTAADTAFQRTTGRLGSAVALHKGASTVASGLATTATKVPSGQNAFTVVAWIRPASDSPKNAYLLTDRTVTGGVPNAWTGARWDGWHVRFWGSGDKIAFGYSAGDWTSPETKPDWFAVGDLPAATYSNDGQWHQVAITRDEALLTTLYFDGAKIVEKTVTANQNVASSARLLLGAMDKNNSFSGDYDEVKIFSRALTADEVASDYDATKPLAETRILDEATAHWTFDKLEAEGDKTVFRDTGAAGLACDFLNTTNAAGEGVLCVMGGDANGGAAYVKNAGSYLQLFDSSRAGTNLVQYGWPTFTISLRIKNVACTGLNRNAVFCFGNAKEAQGCLRLSYEGRSLGTSGPVIARVLAGNSYTNGTAGVALTDTIVAPSAESPWVTYTFVNDMNTVGLRLMTVYRDGMPIQTISTHGKYQNDNQTSFAFDLSRLDIGYNTYTNYTGFLVDDLCVFRKRVLSATDVKRLVREQAGKTCAPLGDAQVTVADGATLAISNQACSVTSLKGAGSVMLGAYATLQSGSWTSFTGTIGGEGTVVIPASGTVDLGADPALGCHTIVTAPHLEYPDDFSGWTVKGLPAERYRFRVKGNAFQVSVFGGLIVVFR